MTRNLTFGSFELWQIVLIVGGILICFFMVMIARCCMVSRAKRKTGKFTVEETRSRELMTTNRNMDEITPEKENLLSTLKKDEEESFKTSTSQQQKDNAGLPRPISRRRLYKQQ